MFGEHGLLLEAPHDPSRQPLKRYTSDDTAHDMLSTAIMRLAEHDVFRHSSSPRIAVEVQAAAYYQSGYWSSVHYRDYQLTLDLTGNLDAPVMTPAEQIIAFLREHPDSTCAKISEFCGKQKNVGAALVEKTLLLDGNIGKRKISNNEVRHFLINEVLKTKPIPDYYKAAIRQSVEYENSREAVIPIIRIFPGRSAVFMRKC